MTTEIRSWYPFLIASGIFLTASMHAALWKVTKGHDASRARAMKLAGLAWWGVLITTLAVAVTTFLLEPQLGERLAASPWGYLFPVVTLAGLFGIRASRSPEMEFLALFFSCVFLAGATASAIFGALPSLIS